MNWGIQIEGSVITLVNDNSLWSKYNMFWAWHNSMDGMGRVEPSLSLLTKHQ
jgi:hypothetical protein